MSTLTKESAEALDLSLMVRLVDYRWNQLYVSLLLLYEKLETAGVIYFNCKVFYDA